MQLSNKQLQVIDGVMDSIIKGRREVSIGGMAGTGKSTIAKVLIERISQQNMNYVVLTPTGKAANVLRSKGVNADTIHSAIYTYKGEHEDEETGEKYMVWHDKETVEGLPTICIIDEASMVNAKIADDLRSFGFQIIWIGDYGQLPPIGKDPMIMRHPDFKLTEIFRQADGNDLIDFAYKARNNEPFDNTFKNVQMFSATINEIIDNISFDQAICGFNNTRIKFNQAYRKKMGYKKILEVGERLICLFNNRRQSIFNGMQLTVLEIHGIEVEYIDVTVAIEGDPENTRRIYLRKSALGNPEPDTKDTLKNELVCDYAYCITCHKSQGSEWQNVLVINEVSKNWEHARWLYTAATRAKNSLTLIFPKK